MVRSICHGVIRCMFYNVDGSVAETDLEQSAEPNINYIDTPLKRLWVCRVYAYLGFYNPVVVRMG